MYFLVLGFVFSLGWGKYFTFQMTKSKWWGLVWSVYIMVVMICEMNLYEFNKFFSNAFQCTNVSISLAALSSFLLLLMYLSSTKVLNVTWVNMNYNVIFLLLFISLVLSFLSSTLLYFYFWFEMSLIPTLFIILGWGYQPERLQAGVYFMMYTLMVSLPLLLILLVMDQKHVGLILWDSLLHGVSLEVGEMNLFMHVIAFMMMMAFLVKLPMFLVNLWLPKSHVEAPVAGSMILAGVLLKLGGYGLTALLFKFIELYKIGYIFFVVSLVGMLFIGLVCCSLNDLKALVAYSSVAHMGLVIMGVFSGLSWGLTGALVMMISHGLSSSGLFCFVNMMYERLSSRSIYMNKGIINFIPIFSLFMFLLCCSNISAPPTVNLLAEIMLVISIFKYEYMSMFLFPVGSFLGAVFTFYMFSFSHQGKFFSELNNFFGGKFVEFHTLNLHLVPIYVFILKNELLFT